MSGEIGIVYRIRETSGEYRKYVVLTSPNLAGKVIVARLGRPLKAIQNHLILDGKHDARLFGRHPANVEFADFAYFDAEKISGHLNDHSDMVEGNCPQDILHLIVKKAQEVELTAENILSELKEEYSSIF